MSLVMPLSYKRSVHWSEKPKDAGPTPAGGTIIIIGGIIMEWISCKDHLPEKSGSYFVTFRWGEIVRCTEKMEFHLMGHHYRWVWNGRDMTSNVKAWMTSEPYMGD